jgi:hypothetical protein
LALDLEVCGFGPILKPHVGTAEEFDTFQFVKRDLGWSDEITYQKQEQRANNLHYRAPSDHVWELQFKGN